MAKQCSKCNEMQLASNFRKHKGCFGGIRSSCKECDRKRIRLHREENKEIYRERERKYREENYDKVKARIDRWVEANRDRLREAKQQWVERNREKVSQYKAEWYMENRERISKEGKERYEENREYYCSKASDYAKRNPEILRLARMRRRARELGLPHDITLNEYYEIMGTFGNSCALTSSTDNLQLDHVIPVSKGGGTTKGNLIPLDGTINNSKHSSNIFEWFNATKRKRNIDECKFNELIDYLANVNDMSREEYEEYVNSHYTSEVNE